jgi:hypothetical protein
VLAVRCRVALAACFGARTSVLRRRAIEHRSVSRRESDASAAEDPLAAARSIELRSDATSLHDCDEPLFETMRLGTTTAGKFVRDAVVRAAQAGMTRGDKTDIAEAS